MTDPGHLEEMQKLGLDVRYMASDEYGAFLAEYEQTLREAMGW